MTESAEARNEQAKLSAGYVNHLAVALFVVGGLTPLATIITEGGLPPLLLVVVSGVCIAGSIGPHLFARWLLRRLVSS